jgi:hypothetical protein
MPLRHQFDFAVALVHATVELVRGLERKLGQVVADLLFGLLCQRVANQLQRCKGKKEHDPGHDGGQQRGKGDTVEAEAQEHGSGNDYKNVAL